MAEKLKAKPEPRIDLTVQELQFISQALFNGVWNGVQWRDLVTPLINKLAKMIDNVIPRKRT